MEITRKTPLGDLPQLARVDEAAAWLGCSRGLVFEMCRRGELPAVRLGRLLRIPRDGLAAWLAKSQNGGGRGR